MRRVRPPAADELWLVEDYAPKWSVVSPSLSQQDAAFYCDGGGSRHVLCLERDGFEVDIYCDGEMLVKNTVTDESYRCADDLVSAGVDNDGKLMASHLEWLNNPWFDLYVHGEHLDEVSHELSDAIASAKAWLDDCSSNAHQIEEGMIDLPAV